MVYTFALKMQPRRSPDSSAELGLEVNAQEMVASAAAPGSRPDFRHWGKRLPRAALQKPNSRTAFLNTLFNRCPTTQPGNFLTILTCQGLVLQITKPRIPNPSRIPSLKPRALTFPGWEPQGGPPGTLPQLSLPTG